MAEWAADTPGQLLVRADAALYRAEADGRDRVHVAAGALPALAAVPLPVAG